MADGFTYLYETAKKLLAIVLSGARRGTRGSNLTNVQCKPIWNCHYESPLYNEYILIECVVLPGAGDSRL
jgi:hypothetical protein